MRVLVVLLLALNALLWTWWSGHLGPLWDAPGQGEREPSRVARQIKPEAVTVLGTQAHAPKGPANGTAVAPAAPASR